MKPTPKEARDFLEYYEYGDPLKDRYDEAKLIEWLASLCEERAKETP